VLLPALVMHGTQASPAARSIASINRAGFCLSLLPSVLIVVLAEALRVKRFATPLNGAYTFGSHSILLRRFGWSERAAV
jgi:hypothetical protein